MSKEIRGVSEMTIAKWFTTENLGYAVKPPPEIIGDAEAVEKFMLERFRQCEHDHGCEGLDVSEELDAWVSDVRRDRRTREMADTDLAKVFGL